MPDFEIFGHEERKEVNERTEKIAATIKSVLS